MNKNIKIFVNYFLGPLLFIALSYSLYKQIIHQPDLPARWHQIKASWWQPAFLWVIVLMLINWGLEAAKWQLLVKPLEHIGFLKAYQSVLAGCSITMLTPNRTGEFGGRVMFLKTENRLKGIAATVLGSMSQLLITLMAGCLGVYYFRHPLYLKGVGMQSWFQQWIFSDGVIALSMLLMAGLLLFIFKGKWLVLLSQKIKMMHKLTSYIEVIKTYRNKDLLRLITYSSLRYLVFILQYRMIFQLLQVHMPLLECMALVAVFYLMMALVPTIGFTELPVRGAAAVLVFGIYSNNVIGIQAATLSIWFINLVIPAFVGSIFILGVKLMKEKNELD